MHIGLTELLLIIIVAFACIKPSKLIEYSGKLGSALRSVADAQNKLNEEVKEITEPIQEVTNEVNSALADVNKELKGDV